MSSDDDVTTSVPAPHHCERELVDSLLECDQEDDVGQFLDTLPSESIHAVAAWQPTLPNVRYEWPTKKRPPQQTQDDIGISYHGNHFGYHSKRSTAAAEEEWLGRTARKDAIVPAWKMGVEPKTYRYLPNNGIYKAYKVANGYLEIQRPTRRTWERLTPEQKQLQREIKRELRKEFEMFNQYEKQKKEGGFKTRSSPRDRDRMTSDDGANNNHKVNVRENSFSPVELPPIGVPLVAKSHNEGFLQSFRNRMSALDEEIKKDQHLFRKSYDDVTSEDKSYGVLMTHWTSSSKPMAGGTDNGVEKPSPRFDIGRKLKNMERVRRAAAEAQRAKDNTTNGEPTAEDVELNMRVSCLNPKTADTDSPVVKTTKPQAPILHNMPSKKETLTEETFQIRKLPIKQDGVDPLREPCNFSSSYVYGKSELRDAPGSPTFSVSPTLEYRESAATPPGDPFQIRHYGHGSSSAPVVMETGTGRSPEEARTSQVKYPGVVPKATEMASTKESLQKLISASKLFASATGPSHKNSGGNISTTRRTRPEGPLVGDAFLASPVGKIRARREAGKRQTTVVTQGFLPEISGKSLGQREGRQRFIRS